MLETFPPGRRVEIAYNDQGAIVVEVGGGIRCYEVGGRSVFDPYPIDTICDGAHGAPRVPWPNRLADGHYRFHDKHQLPAGTEPDDGTGYDFRKSACSGRRRWTSPSPTSSGCRRPGPDPPRWNRSTKGRVRAEDGYRVKKVYTGRPWPHSVVTSEAPLRLMGRPSRPAARTSPLET